MSLNEFLQLMLEIQMMHFARVYGIFISGDAAADVRECAENCNALEACEWFTYNNEDQSCTLTSDREFVSDCPTCTYGHDGCIPGMMLPFSFTVSKTLVPQWGNLEHDKSSAMLEYVLGLLKGR